MFGAIRWLFGLEGPPTKAALEGHKSVKLGGAVYTIRKINPMVDFPPDKMPSIFTSHQSARKVDPARAVEANAKKGLEDMMAIVKAGLVSPNVSDPKSDVTVADIFRVPEHGAELYLAILDHTLNRFTGLRKVFFSRRIRASFWTAYQAATEPVPAQ